MKFETILKYHLWHLCQISRTNHAIICLYYYPQTRRYLTFLNHTFVSSWATSRAIESRGKTRAKEQTILWRKVGGRLLMVPLYCATKVFVNSVDCPDLQILF